MFPGFFMCVPSNCLSLKCVFKIWVDPVVPRNFWVTSRINLHLKYNAIGIFPTLYGNNIATSAGRKKRNTI